MKLFEHVEFDQAMLRAADHFRVSEQFIEKDYYVTEILRIVAQELGDKAMFKGGTSLSKGWNLISRFSEDIDLFVNREKFEPPPGKNKMDAILKQLHAPIWSPMVSVHETASHEDVHIYLCRDKGHTKGMVIVAAEPRELTIVNLVGDIDPAKLAQLGGRFGVPRLPLKTSAPTNTPPRD